MVTSVASSFPILRVLGGSFFVLAGVAYYYDVTLNASISFVFVAAGFAVLLLAVLGHRARGGDVAVFVIGLLVLSAFVSSGVRISATSVHISQMATSSQLPSKQVELLASSDVGRIDISFSNRSDLGYQVNFTRSNLSFPLIIPGKSPLASLTNQTRAGTFVLNATSRSYDLSITIGTGYVLNVTASTGTGSIDIRTLGSETLGVVSLRSGTGSIDANLTSQRVGAVSLQVGTGSIRLTSNDLAPSGQRVPITLATGTGSVNFKVKLPSGTAVSVDASVGLGSVYQNLQGFSISPQSSTSRLIATAGDTDEAARSFVIQASTGLGSVALDSEFLG
ncbi:MAG: hypothetical protein OK455_07725 [Thaumarchaeota archaeon]|nr:hypothetical protein [Nitrososphaerota archaeon]